MTQISTVADAAPRTSGRRRVLAGIALVLACLSILLTTLAVWTHQVALNTDRFTSLVGHVVTDPAVTDPISLRISEQVVDALDVQARVESRLPDAVKPLAGALSAAVTEAIDRRLRVALQGPRLQNALVGTISYTHGQIVRLLRGQTEAVGIVDGYLTLDVFPVVGAALTELQSMGLIPASVQLPDLSSPEAPEVLAQRLESALGITLPPDFGTIRLMPAARLATAQTMVRAFDIIVILLIVVSAMLIALALWLAADRRRMLIYLGVGTIIAFLLARLAMQAAENVIVGGIADDDVAGAARAVVDATLQNLRSITAVILVATAILAIAAYLWGRPKWVVATTSYMSDTAGRAGSAASAATTGGAAGVAGRGPDLATVERTVRENRSLVERFGLAIVVFVLVWIAVGLGVALLGAALVIAFELLLRAVAGPSGDEAADTSLERDVAAGAASAVTAAPDEVTTTYAAPAAVEPVVVGTPAEEPPPAKPPAAKPPDAKATAAKPPAAKPPAAKATATKATAAKPSAAKPPPKPRPKQPPKSARPPKPKPPTG
jgi:hypothetical protein